MKIALGLAALSLYAGNVAYGQNAGTAAAGTQANGAKEKEKPMEEVVVTGTIIRNSEAATASPIAVLSSGELKLRGINTVADAVTALPSNNAGTMNTSWSSFGFTPGASAPALRGLTSADTLTVFDGMRMAPYPLADDGVRNFVDLGTIPDSIVQRIEVLKDGASSTYGADAVAAVVNVITKKQITGLHFNTSYGASEKGDGIERRGDLTWGSGDLGEDGFNFYINLEGQVSDAIASTDRGFPFNTQDWTSICTGSGASRTCLQNNNINGLQADGTIHSVSTTGTPVPMVQPYDASLTDPALGNWQLLNPSAGCRNLKAVNPSNAADVSLTGPVCEFPYYNADINVFPKVSRHGLTLHYTKEITDNIEAYAMFNYYRVKTTQSGGTPYYFGGTTPPGAAGVIRVSITPVILPVYVCPLAPGYPTCTASNGGTLNPNNPFAAAGETARLSYRLPFPRENDTNSEAYRYATGVNGSFGDGLWNYTADFVSSEIDLIQTYRGYPVPRHILNVVYDGSFNFVDPSQNPQSMWDYVAPPVRSDNTSKLQQVQATLSRSVVDLPGGSLVAAIGLAWRHEAVESPDVNPPNVDPYERPLSLNSVSVNGSRRVKSAFFEINAPFLDSLTVDLSGRYDKYSTGQSKFSPKLGVQFQPIDMLKLRGTYSEGFRIPSFNEAFGAPTTGYVSHTVTTTTPGGAAFLAAHNNDAYASSIYSYGLTASSDPTLKPEKSKAYTAGIVLQPMGGLTITLDYYHIKVSQLITSADYSDVLNQYYGNNGVVNVPGITVIPAAADPDYPNALPLIGFIQYSYQNADSKVSSGIDLGTTFTYPFTNFLFKTHLEAVHLIELSQTQGGVKQDFAGTLSPCNITSCSGAPDWRATWVNSIDWQDFTFALTTNYTSGYSDASVDFGGDPNNCVGSIGVSVAAYDDGTPFKCSHGKWLDWDFTTTYQVGKFQIFANVINLFDKKPEFDPAPTYGLYGFNPAWELDGWRGRFYRVGVKYDL